MASRVKLWLSRYFWWLTDIGGPWLFTRLLLLTLGLFSGYIFPAEIFPERGWLYSPHRWLDIWVRWDTGWYMSIVVNGYTAEKNIYGQGNAAFAPLYPYLVRAAHGLFIPEALRTPGTIVAVGIVLSNLAFLVFLTLLYKLIQEHWPGEAVAKRAVFYLCIFPTSIAFSSFYTESLYMVLTLAAFYAAEKGKWWLAGIAGGLSALTRLTGVLIVIPLLILYWKQKRRLCWDVAWLGWIPVALVGFGAVLYRITGDPLELFHAHDGWGTMWRLPWTAFFIEKVPYVPIWDRVTIAAFTVLAFFTFRLGPSYGLWALMNTLLVLMVKGTTVSITRYVLVAFPVFVLLAVWSDRRPWLYQALCILFTAFLAFFMVLWARSYWVM